MHFDQLRLQLDKVLGSSVSDRVWDYLEDKGFVGEAWDGAADINYLADEARKLIDLSDRAPRDVSSIDSGRALRDRMSRDKHVWGIWARSILLAQEAEKNEPEVQSFRDDVLGGTLLDPFDVGPWIKTQAEREGQMAWTYPIPFVYDYEEQELRAKLPAGIGIEDDVLLARDHLGVLEASEVRMIEYADFTTLTFHGIPAGGVLERLWRIGTEDLMKRYPWSAAQATMFVLTGWQPMVRSVEAEIRFVDELPASSRVVLTIDPTETPAAVSEIYKEKRKELLGKRHRSMSAKHIRLAMFVAERPDDETWEDKRQAWNRFTEGEDLDGFQYQHRSNFTRDAIQARKRLLYPEYRGPSKYREVINLPPAWDSEE